jgi:hypothetical protein
MGIHYTIHEYRLWFIWLTCSDAVVLGIPYYVDIGLSTSIVETSLRPANQFKSLNFRMTSCMSFWFHSPLHPPFRSSLCTPDSTVIQWASTVWHHYNRPVENVTGLSCPVLLDLSSGRIHGLPIANAAGLSARESRSRRQGRSAEAWLRRDSEVG